eukprot:3453017-Pleurochrysis_carterae.AAC.1
MSAKEQKLAHFARPSGRSARTMRVASGTNKTPKLQNPQSPGTAQQQRRGMSQHTTPSPFARVTPTTPMASAARGNPGVSIQEKAELDRLRMSVRGQLPTEVGAGLRQCTLMFATSSSSSSASFGVGAGEYCWAVMQGEVFCWRADMPHLCRRLAPPAEDPRTNSAL